MNVERVLVATDFSAAGQRAVQSAADWARREKAALRIVHVAPSARRLAGLWRSSMRDVHTVHRQAADALRRVAEAIDPARQLDVSTGLVTGHAAQQIARAAVDYAADLLVIGARGEHETTTGQPGLGGTAAKLVSSSPAPLLLIRKRPAEHAPVVVAAVDLTPVSSSVLEWAGQCAAGGNVDLLHVYEVPFAERLEAYGVAKNAIDVYATAEHEERVRQLARLVESAGDKAGLAIRRTVQRGNAVRRLFDQIGLSDADCVVLGKHSVRSRGATNKGYGSVCRYMAFYSPTDVLIVPPAAEA